MSEDRPAFPANNQKYPDYFGLTKREWFAAHCPESELPTIDQALLALNSDTMTRGNFARLRVKMRYAWADMMLNPTHEQQDDKN